ncbi:hypothetical protein MNBD_PLANCTO02-1139, partial [hydrothermal vent metagenome]
MKLGIISDTHGDVESAQRGIAELQQHQVDLIIHCGDIGSPEIIPLFNAIPTHFVFGNIDHHSEPLRAAIELHEQTCCGRFGTLELEGKQIAFLHSDDASLFNKTTTNGEYDLVCYGHTHKAKLHSEGKTLVLNPGAMYRTNQYSVAVVVL